MTSRHCYKCFSTETYIKILPTNKSRLPPIGYSKWLACKVCDCRTFVVLPKQP